MADKITLFRNQFPILCTSVNGKPLIYLDNAATTQKPRIVLDAMMEFYTTYNANIYRGAHSFGEQATSAYESARATVAQFIGADAQEIVFTRSTTESINFVAATWAAEHLVGGDEILLTELEHHANIVPWQELCRKKGTALRYIPVLPDGTLDLDQLPKLLSARTKLVAVCHVSNALGTCNDIATIIKQARSVGARTLIDAAQSVAHHALDVKALGCDFLAFSGHKIFGPTGIGVLFIKKELHDQVPPYQTGGGMVYEVDFHKASWLSAPMRYEAGTPPIAEAIGLKAALEFLGQFRPLNALQEHEARLCSLFVNEAQKIKNLTFFGPIKALSDQGHLVSFNLEGVHPHDVAAYLNSDGIAVRAGNHCAQPLAKKMGITGSVRVSFAPYNTEQEVEAVIAVLKRI